MAHEVAGKLAVAKVLFIFVTHRLDNLNPVQDDGRGTKRAGTDRTEGGATTAAGCVLLMRLCLLRF